jgi:hypothetical protein
MNSEPNPNAQMPSGKARHATSIFEEFGLSVSVRRGRIKRRFSSIVTRLIRMRISIADFKILPFGRTDLHAS